MAKKTKVRRVSGKRSMKDQQGLIAVIALAVVAILGVGYAAINSTLTIGGTGTEATAVPDSSAFNINYTSNTVHSISTGGTGDVADTTSNYPTKTASFTVTGMSKMNETATLTYVITNASADLGATLATPSCTQTDTNGYFELGTTVADSSLTKSGGTKDNTTQTVTVKLIKLPVDANVSTTVTCTLVATATNS